MSNFTKKCGINNMFNTPALCAHQSGNYCTYQDKSGCDFIEMYVNIEFKINMSLQNRIPIEPEYILKNCIETVESDYITEIRIGR